MTPFLYSAIIACLPPIAVVVRPEGARANLVNRLLAACSSASRPRTCVAAEGEVSSDSTVTWRTASEVDVEVAPSNSEAPLRRSIAFRPGDAEEDRWHATGLVVAALMSTTTEHPKKPVDARPPPLLPPPPSQLFLDGGALAGTGLHGGAPRYGGWLFFAYELPRAHWLASLAGSYAIAARGPGTVTPAWTSLSVGFGYVFELPAIHAALRPRVEGSLVHESASADAASSKGRWLDGLGGALAFTWPARAPVAIVVEGSGTFLSGGTGVRIDDQKAASFPAHTFAALLGIEVPILQ